MNKKPDKQLLEKFFTKSCTYEEARHVIDFLNDKRNSEEVKKLLKSRWNAIDENESHHSDLESIYSNIILNIQNISPTPEKTRPRTDKLLILKVAASVAIFFACAVALYFYVFSGKPAVATKPVVIKSTGVAERLTTRLPDGTFVTLNAQSQLSYVDGFDKKERRVVLNGEAYFEVSKDSLKPFIVKSGPVETKALGTAFNIKAYSNTKNVVVSLTEGKVEVTSEVTAKEAPAKQLLMPGEEAHYNHEGNFVAIRNFDYKSVVGWREGVLVFDNADIDEIKEKLENWFGVEVTLKNRPSQDWSFSSEYKNVSLKDVLDGLKYSKNINYVINDHHVEIDFN